MEWEAPTDQDHRSILRALHEHQFDVAAATLARHVKWIGTKTGAKRHMRAPS